MRRELATLAAALLLACGGEAATPEQPALPGDDVVLAQVDGEAITQYDLDRALRSTLGPLAASVEDETRRDVLESLVTSRALAAARERELDPVQRLALERETAAMREQLLVRQYLAVHAPSAPPTAEDVRAYYEAHPERFGARPVTMHELLHTTRDLDDDERERVLEALGTAAARPDWAALAAQLVARGLPIAHSTGDSEDAVLHERLRRALTRLGVGQTSTVIFVDGRAFLLRTTGHSERPARPLAEVSDEIRQALAPRSVRDSIRRVRDDALEGVAVVYRDAE